MAAASDKNNDDSVVDVVVIGAGISGLCAAHDIIKERKNSKVVILEAKDRVGGRLDSANLKSANGEDKWDLGGQWVGSNQKDIMALLEELGLETYKQWYNGEKLVQLSDGTIRKYAQSIPSISYVSLLDVYLLSNKIDTMCSQVPLDDPSKCAHAEQWDGMTVESWVKQCAWTQASAELLDIAVSCIFGVTPAQLSLLYFLHYVKSCGGWNVLIESGKKGSAQEFKIKGGAHNVALVLAEKIGWNRIQLCQPVTSISQSIDRVVVTSRSGQSYVSKYVILAIPPRLTSKIEFTPRLTYNKQRTIENLIPSHLTKFIVTYRTAFWRKNGLSAEAGHFSGRHNCETNPVTLTFDGTTSNGSPAIIGFISSYAAAKWSDKTDNEKKEAVIQALNQYFGPNPEVPLDFAIKDWSQEEWNGGCPVDVMVPGAITNYGDCLWQPCQRIHWASTDTSFIHRGYISGAVATGHRAASEVLKRLESHA